MSTPTNQGPAAPVLDPVALLTHTHSRATERATVQGLRERLASQAAAAGLVDVAYRTVDSPLGPLLLACTDDGLIRVAFERQDHAAVLGQLADVVSPRVLRAPHRLDAVARQFDEFFAGRRTGFDLRLDLRLAEGFRRGALVEVASIGFGSTRSYASVAQAVGHPGAARAVGTACRLNPVPLVIPCHRVVRADGSTGDYAGGAAAKRWLLGWEADSRE